MTGVSIEQVKDEVQRAVRLYNAAMAHRDRLSSLNQYDKREAIERYKSTMRTNWESGQLSREAVFGAIHTPNSVHWVPLQKKFDPSALTVADFQIRSGDNPTPCYSMAELSDEDVLHHPTLGPIPAFDNFTVLRPSLENAQSTLQAMVDGSREADPTEYSWNARDSNYVARPSSAWLVAKSWKRLSTLSPGTPLPAESMDANSIFPRMIPSDQVSILTARANALIAKLKSMKAATEGDSQGDDPMDL